ncbi:proline-, glutamic acid- and leucine-rich protein 1 isoform X2 [Drosophila grimshawi]|uniref:proline-, glutamic acid- and leucine-rich protein 1 isoform X2 n=1 Tax=Drosophila grimshawi TaxID=7222 RepID=UPI000C86F325|nr:proline-, glutamic acid- and leucine-rich protein 1 isoform X2 [Drosophila grimshawi]
MNPYEEALHQLVDHMLAEKNCKVGNQSVSDKLVELLQNKLREIAVTTSIGANLASRATPCYFDVERTFRLHRIHAADLWNVRNTKPKRPMRSVVLNRWPLETDDDDIHRMPLVHLSQLRGMRNERHIPKYMVPFPGLHAYRQTPFDICKDNSYATKRERRAQLHLDAQNALYGLSMRRQPNISLLSESTQDTTFLLPAARMPDLPAFLDALMPRDQGHDGNVLEDNEPENENALSNPFLRAPVGPQNLEENPLNNDFELNSNDCEATEYKKVETKKGEVDGEVVEEDKLAEKESGEEKLMQEQEAEEEEVGGQKVEEEEVEEEDQESEDEDEDEDEEDNEEAEWQNYKDKEVEEEEFAGYWPNCEYNDDS